jgi:hypothetical protein
VITRRVHRAGELNSRRGLKQSGVVAPDHPQADDGAAQRL